MARKQFVETSAATWTADLERLRKLIVEANPPEKERLVAIVLPLQLAGEAFFILWQEILADLESGDDGLEVSPYARKILRGQALRLWMEPNTVVRQKIWDDLSSAAVPKPRAQAQAPRSDEVARLPGVTAERPSWNEPA